jgi:hypothetical protein
MKKVRAMPNMPLMIHELMYGKKLNPKEEERERQQKRLQMLGVIPR